MLIMYIENSAFDVVISWSNRVRKNGPIDISVGGVCVG